METRLREVEVERGHCGDHTGQRESIKGLREKLSVLIWIMSGNGALLLIILGVLLSDSATNAVQTEKIQSLEMRITKIEKLVEKKKE